MILIYLTAAPPCQVEIFEHGWHDGLKYTVTQNTAELQRDNDLSSLKVTSGCCAILYKDANYRGASKKVCWNMQVGDLGSEWNDQVSSIKIERLGNMENIYTVFFFVK